MDVGDEVHEQKPTDLAVARSVVFVLVETRAPDPRDLTGTRTRSSPGCSGPRQPGTVLWAGRLLHIEEGARRLDRLEYDDWSSAPGRARRSRSSFSPWRLGGQRPLSELRGLIAWGMDYLPVVHDRNSHTLVRPKGSWPCGVSGGRGSPACDRPPREGGSQPFWPGRLGRLRQGQ